MKNEFSNSVKQTYGSVRSPDDLARRIQQDFERSGSTFNYLVPAFATLFIGVVALTVFKSDFSTGQAPDNTVGIASMTVSQVTSQTGQFARLSIGQINIPQTASVNVTVIRIGSPGSMPNLSRGIEQAMQDG